MPETVTTHASEAIELLKAALAEGHTIALSLISPPRIVSSSEPPLVVLCGEKFGLTLAESRAFATLLKHGHVSKEDLHAAISGSGPTTDIKIVGVTMHWLRKKLLPYGVEVLNVYGFGYRLGQGALERVRELLADLDIADPTTPLERADT
jgi:hypothetical protein